MGLTAERREELLSRFAPRLHFDALERWRPAAADAFLERSTYVGADDAALPGTPPAEPAMRERLAELKGRINPLRDGPSADTRARTNALLSAYGDEQDLATAGACYGRVVPAGTDAWFLQYWLFYPDNPCVLPPGRHDGDWELAQVRVRAAGDDLEALSVTLAGHGKPETRPCASPDRGPDVFVAVDSHASYFIAGAQPKLPLSDVCSPAEPGSPGAVPEVIPLPVAADRRDWAHWRGRWGMDRGPGTWLALKLHMRRTPAYLRWLNKVGAGESPPSPGRQGASWSQPRLFELRGRQRRWTNVAGQRLVHLLGRLTWPRATPQVEVTETAPGNYEVSAEPAGHFARRIRFVAVTFDAVAADGKRRALAAHSVRCGRAPVQLELKAEGDLTWRAAGYNRLRQRGEPISGTA